MADLIGQLRESRKNPSVLKHILISIRSVKPDTLIFIFEGVEDIGVYETWIQRTAVNLIYEPVAGNGKEQLLGLYNKLQEEDSQLLRHLYFFVDCDFDEYGPNNEHVFVLDAYSIENLLCCPDVLDSILTDEFRCAGSPQERQRVLQKFGSILTEFKQASVEVNFTLFAARRTNIRVVKKPEEVRQIAEITLSGVRRAFNHLFEVLELDTSIEENLQSRLRTEFEGLENRRAQRGKYLLSMFRQWLRALSADRKSEVPQLFDQPFPTLPGEPWTVPIRRLASRSQIPSGLTVFISNAATAASVDTVISVKRFATPD